MSSSISMSSSAPAGEAVSTGFRFLDMENVPEPERYKLFMGSIVPRPVALVTTLGESGLVNAAPFSSFMSLSAINNLVAISINERTPGAIKDTVRNIVARREFVINTVSESMAVATQICSENVPADVSEVALAQLNLLPSRSIETPRIAESPIHFECVLQSISQFETAHLIVGKVVVLQARDGLIDGSRIRLADYAPLGRLAGRAFCKIGEVVNV